MQPMGDRFVRRALVPFTIGVLLLALSAAALAWHRISLQHANRTATTLVASIAGFPDLDPSGKSCSFTGERSGLGGWRRAALCLQRRGRRLGMARRDVHNRLFSASVKWYGLDTNSVTPLVDSIARAMRSRGATEIQITGKCPELMPANVLERGAWQGLGFQALLTDWRNESGTHLLQLDATSTSFHFCPSTQ